MAEASHEDTAILSLCAAFDVLEHKKRELSDTIKDDEAFSVVCDEINVEQKPMIYRLSELHATSMEAHRARARTLSLYMGELELREFAGSDSWWDRLTAAILRDLAAVPE